MAGVRRRSGVGTDVRPRRPLRRIAPPLLPPDGLPSSGPHRRGRTARGTRKIIRATLATLDRVGPDSWCGYSYSWLGNLKARAFDGEGAAAALRTFAACFCLPNSFHANGDQTKSGKSKFTYRPFTLEGNFAFAAGVQEMLLQSHTGIVHLFPAVPAVLEGRRVLLAPGRRARSSSRPTKSHGQVYEVRIVSREGRPAPPPQPVRVPLSRWTGNGDRIKEEVIVIDLKPGQEVRLEAHDE